MVSTKDIRQQNAERRLSHAQWERQPSYRWARAITWWAILLILLGFWYIVIRAALS